MITEIEISPSDRAICKGCNKKIGIGTPRGVWEEIRMARTYVGKTYYCYKCTGLLLDDALKTITKTIKNLKKDLKKMIKENSKAIVLAKLENGKEN